MQYEFILKICITYYMILLTLYKTKIYSNICIMQNRIVFLNYIIENENLVLNFT